MQTNSAATCRCGEEQTNEGGAAGGGVAGRLLGYGLPGARCRTVM